MNMKKAEEILYPFSIPYSGKPISEVAKDKKYIRYMLTQSWFVRNWPEIATYFKKELAKTRHKNIKVTVKTAHWKFCLN